jgi:hypothetical protein
MSITNPLLIFSCFFALLGLIFPIIMFSGTKRRTLFASSANLLTALLMLSLAALSGTISIAIQGYNALTREEIAATVKIEPTGNQKFTARFVMPDGSENTFSLSGDQLYVDAHILKWKPLVNIFGLHTSYELDRVGGRYASLSDEKTKPRTVFSLAKEKPINLNMYDLRQRFSMLTPFLDAEYGSATFINTNKAEEFKVIVSTTGLLIRKISDQAG